MTHTGNARDTAAAVILDALRLFIQPGQVTELRCLPQPGNTAIVSGFFDYAHLAEMAREATHHTGRSAGVYFVPNPLNPAVLTRRMNRAATGKPRGGMSTDKDVLSRRWLYIDVDPVRAPGHEHDSSTQAEHDSAREVADAIKDDLAACGWGEPIVVDSGNGWHLYCPLSPDMAGIDAAGLLQTLAVSFDTPAATVDVRVGNPSRIMKLPGTLACKGVATSDRPHRLARIVDVPKGWTAHVDKESARSERAGSGPT